MKTFRLFLIVLLVAAVSTAHAVGLLDSDAEVQAPIRKGEKPVIPLDTHEI